MINEGQPFVKLWLGLLLHIHVMILCKILFYILCLFAEVECCPISVPCCVCNVARHSDPALNQSSSSADLLAPTPLPLVHQRRAMKLQLMSSLAIVGQARHETALHLLLSSTHRRVQIAVTLCLCNSCSGPLAQPAPHPVHYPAADKSDSDECQDLVVESPSEVLVFSGALDERVNLTRVYGKIAVILRGQTSFEIFCATAEPDRYSDGNAVSE